MQIRWSDAGKASARRFMRDDQDGLRAVGLAILALADDPYPAEAFHRGTYHRLRVFLAALTSQVRGWDTAVLPGTPGLGKDRVRLPGVHRA